MSSAVAATAADGLEVLQGDSLEKKKEDARRRIAFLVVGFYLLFVLANIAVPVILYATSSGHGAFTFSNLKDLTSVITGALAGLLGILGFVVGYYFKALDDKKAS